MLRKPKGKVPNGFAVISSFTARTFILVHNVGNKKERKGFFVSKHRVDGVPIGEYESKNCVRVAVF